MFLDIGIGLVLAVAVGTIFDLEPSWAFLALGAAGALLPDIDFAVWLVGSRGRIDEWAHRHRDILHYPLLFVPTAAFVGAMLAGTAGACLLCAAAITHFLHDTAVPGWGIRWLWPFDRRYYMLDRESGKQVLRRWTRSEQDAVVLKRGRRDWFRLHYLRPSRNLLREFIFAGVGIAVAILWQILG